MQTAQKSNWLVERFEGNIYPIMTRLARHRTMLVARLHGAIPPHLLGKISFARNEWDAIEELFLHLSQNNPALHEAMDRFLEELPDIEKQDKDAPTELSAQIDCDAAYFDRSPVCEGRDVIVNEIVQLLTRGANNGLNENIGSALLHGVGGVGKSTIALEVLRHTAIETHFGARRFFVSCEGLRAISDLYGQLASQLNIQLKNKNSRVALLGALRSAKTILVLDNFEDLCPAGAPASGVEPFLSALCGGSDGTNLVITKRGEPDIHLPAQKNIAVGALDTDAAKKAFVGYAPAAVSDPDLPDLVDRLDGLPLAIMLLAHRFRAGITARQLIIAYDIRKHEMLTRGTADSRDTSFQVSVELSLHSQTMSVPGAVGLCFLLSLLPDGADPEVIEAYLQGRLHDPAEHVDLRGVLEVKGALTGAGLASFTPNHLLRMVRPLREYIESKDDIGAEIRENAHVAAYGRASALVEDANTYMRERAGREAAAMRSRVTNQIGNLGSAICRRLSDKDPHVIKKAVIQSCNLGSFVRATVPFIPSFLTLALEKARLSGATTMQSFCLRVLGDIEAYLDNIPTALDHLQQAADLDISSNDYTQRSYSQKSLGMLARRTGDRAKALDHFQTAVRMAQLAGDRSGEADCMIALGDLAALNRQPNAAKTHMENALRLHQELGNRWGQGRALRSLGEFAYDRGDHSTAQNYLGDALQTFRELGDPGGESTVLNAFGRLATQQGDKELAVRHASEARRISEEHRDLAGIANALQTLGFVSLENGELSIAQSYLIDALRLNRRLGHTSGEAQTLHKLGQLYQRQGDLDTALSHLNDSADLYRTLHNPAGESLVNCSLALVYNEQGNFDAAESHSIAVVRFHEEAEGLYNRNPVGRLIYRAFESLRQGDIPATETQFNEALTLSREAGDSINESRCRRALDLLRSPSALRLRDGGGLSPTADTLQLAYQAYTQHDFGTARSEAENALQQGLAAGNGIQAGVGHHFLGVLASEQDDASEALSHFEQAGRLLRDSGRRDLESKSLEQLARIYVQQGDLSGGLSRFRTALQLYMDSDQQLGPPDLNMFVSTVIQIHPSLTPMEVAANVGLVARGGADGGEDSASQEAEDRTQLSRQSAGQTPFATPPPIGASAVTTNRSGLPYVTFLSYTKCDFGGIKRKIEELNNKEGASLGRSTALTQEESAELDALLAYLEEPAKNAAPGGGVLALQKMLTWTERAPALDLIRLLALFAFSAELLPILLATIAVAGSTASHLAEVEARLTARALANGLACATVDESLRDEAINILQSLTAVVDNIGKAGREAAATVSFNYSILLCKDQIDSSVAEPLLEIILKLLAYDDSETVYRSLVAFGNILFCRRVRPQLAANMRSLQDQVEAAAKRFPEQRMRTIITELQSLLADAPPLLPPASFNTATPSIENVKMPSTQTAAPGGTISRVPENMPGRDEQGSGSAGSGEAARPFNVRNLFARSWIGTRRAGAILLALCPPRSLACMATVALAFMVVFALPRRSPAGVLQWRLRDRMRRLLLILAERI